MLKNRGFSGILHFSRKIVIKAFHKLRHPMFTSDNIFQIYHVPWTYLFNMHVPTPLTTATQTLRQKLFLPANAN